MIDGEAQVKQNKIITEETIRLMKKIRELKKKIYDPKSRIQYVECFKTL